ncbi:MAG: hypothetical protein RLZZ356_1890, partial [Verrucomicrobiota bacterium]
MTLRFQTVSRPLRVWVALATLLAFRGLMSGSEVGSGSGSLSSPIRLNGGVAHPLSPASAGPTGRAGFTRLEVRQTGLAFTNRLEGDAFLTNAVANNGSGVAIGDVDGDGSPDVYFCAL